MKSRLLYISILLFLTTAIYVEGADGDHLESKELNGKWGYVETMGEIIIPFIYQEAETYFGDGVAAVKLNDKWGYIDKNNGIVIPFVYQEAKTFDEGLAAVKLNDKWGYIDKNNNTVIPFIYQKSERFCEGLAAVKLNNKWGYIDRNNKRRVPFIYDRVDSLFSNGLTVVGVGKNYSEMRYGVIRKTGHLIAPIIYDSINIGIFRKDIIAKFDGKYGVLDRRMEKIIIPFIYDYINLPDDYYYYNSDSDYAAKNLVEVGIFVEDHFKYGIIDREQNIVVPPIYDSLHFLSEVWYIAKVEIDGEKGFIDRDYNFESEEDYNATIKRWMEKEGKE